MNTRLAERNIKLFYVFQLLREPLFWGPILIIYISRVSGMNLAEIFFMEAVVLILLFVLEIPSGAIADLLGRKRALVIGYALLALDNLFFALASTPFMIWTANIIWVIGYALVSGADSALLYDSLFYLNREKEFMKIRGRSDAYRLALVAVCSIAAGYLAEINLRLPVFLSTFFILANLFNLLFMFEPPVVKYQQYYWREHLQKIVDGLSLVWQAKKILWLIGFAVLVGTVSKIWFFTYNMYFELVELPLVYYGWIFFPLNLVAATVSHNADRLRRRLGETGSMLLMLGCLAMPILLMSYLVFPGSSLLIIIQNITRGLINPFVEDEVHAQVSSRNRATAISIKSASIGVGQFLGLGGFSYCLAAGGLIMSLKILGWATLGGGIVLMYCFLKNNRSS